MRPPFLLLFVRTRAPIVASYDPKELNAPSRNSTGEGSKRFLQIVPEEQDPSYVCNHSQRVWPKALGFFLGPLFWLAACEAGLPNLNLDSEARLLPKWPLSFVHRILRVSHKKRHRFNFQGSVFKNKASALHRKWIFDFITKNFSKKDYLRITGPLVNFTHYYLRHRNPGVKDKSLSPSYYKTYQPLGKFDHSLDNHNATYPFLAGKTSTSFDLPFDSLYWKVMAQSFFTLCPVGDRPWSIRFWEAMLAGSIPVVQNTEDGHPESLQRFGQYEIDWKFYVYTPHAEGYAYYEYHQEWVDANLRNMLRYFTFSQGQNLPSRLSTTSIPKYRGEDNR